MPPKIDAVTEREILIRLDSNVSQLSDTIERFAKALEKLEETKIKDHEDRLSDIEKWKNEFSGAYKVIALMGLLLSVFATLRTFLK